MPHEIALNDRQITTDVEIQWGIPDSKVHGVNMRPIWGRQDPDGPHVGAMNFFIRDYYDRNYT